MTKKEIRLQYSGLIIFAAKMISIATGLIFTLLVTRSTNPSQFGVWSNVFDLETYFVVLAAAIPFWSTRFVARGKEGSTKTGMMANLIIGVISTALYLPLVPFITSALKIGQAYVILYFMVSAQIIEQYLINLSEATLRAERPQAVGYGLLIEEITKIALAYTLMVRLLPQQPLIGAMVSLTIGFLIQIFYYLKLVSPSLKEKTQWNYVREWLKGSTAYIYYSIGNQISGVFLIMLFILGSQAARGDFEVASTIATIIAYSTFLSFALYPMLLANESQKGISSSLNLVLMFAIPLTAGAMAIPDSLLTVLKASYAEAAPVLFILAIDSLIWTIYSFYTYALFGVEKLDEKATVPIRQLVKSSIFKVFTLSYLYSAIILPATYYVLTNFKSANPVQPAVYVAVITMMGHLVMLIVLFVLVRRTIKVIVPWISISKYVFAGAIMGFVLYLAPHPTRFALVLATCVIGGIIYLALLTVIDKEARTLFKSMLREVERLI